MRGTRWLIALVGWLGMTGPAFAAGGGGDSLALPWVIPFAGILLSIALCPLVAPHFWHHHYGKLAAGWATLFLVPYALTHGLLETYDHVAHVYVLEFIPFLILLWALYTVAGGIRLKGRLRGSPLVNSGLLLVGTLLASWMGTTGAAMLLIRPLIRANAWRKRKTHLVVFFIFLVANIGGALTPLGDPPLFLGFLKGVSFFWTTQAMLVPMIICVVYLIILFYLLDSWLLSKEESKGPDDEADEALGLEGKQNFFLLAGVVGAILFAGSMAKEEAFWDQAKYDAHAQELAVAEAQVASTKALVDAAEGAERDALVERMLIERGAVNKVREHAEHDAIRGFHVAPHVTWPFINLVRDGVIILMGVLSLLMTPWALRKRNDFTWFPIVEVAKLFAAIFVTIIPAIAILKEGPSGALAGVVMAVTSPEGEPVNAMYFWLTGGLSSFLDNAPTYLVFFNTAGGNADMLMNEGYDTLLAVSAGAVFMGAMTYIGNAPNFMVRSIAEESGIKMPSFFGYMIRWSIPLLAPIFVVLTFLYFV